MPYIAPVVRAEIDAGRAPENVGELSYVLYKLALTYLANTPMRYAHYGEVVAALELTKVELTRRHLAEFEDLKVQINGDVTID